MSQHIAQSLQGLLMLSLAIGLCACATTPAPPPEPEKPQLYDYRPEGLSGSPSMVINLLEQKAHIYIGGSYAGWTHVATGREGFSTPSGHYKILEKTVDKYSNLYGRTVDAYGQTVRPDADVRKHTPPPGGQFVFAPMPYWLRLTWRGIGLHAGPIPRPGEPASHGCIRLPPEMAETLFHLVEIGTPVQIVR